MKDKIRCSWVDNTSNLYIKYHDNEWCKPVHSDSKLFENLILEIFQAGLSWITILKKRENFRIAFDNFNINKIINYNEEKINELLNNKDIIRHKGKINAVITNAKVFKSIQKEYGSFDEYIWGFTNGKILKDTEENYKTKSLLSDKVSKDLKIKGMKFVGSITIYAYLEAIGIINNHQQQCFKY